MWQQAAKDGDLSQKVECFLVLKEIADEGDRSFFFDAGFTAQVMTGTVVRGYTTLDALPKVAALPFVRKVNLAVK